VNREVVSFLKPRWDRGIRTRRAGWTVRVRRRIREVLRTLGRRVWDSIF
jgi:hypothetical protein